MSPRIVGQSQHATGNEMNHPADARYYAQLDADAAHEAAIERTGTELFEALLASDIAEVDDERFAINISTANLRRAYALANSGARDAALVAFVALTEMAAGKAVTEVIENVVAARKKAAIKADADDKQELRRGE